MRPLWEDVKRIGRQIIPTETEGIVSYFIDMYIWQLYISICMLMVLVSLLGRHLQF